MAAMTDTPDILDRIRICGCTACRSGAAREIARLRAEVNFLAARLDVQASTIELLQASSSSWQWHPAGWVDE